MKCFLKLFFFGLISINTSAQSVNPADNIYSIRDSVSIKTRDGYFISAIVVTKRANTNPLPAILFYTPYYQGPDDIFFGKLSADKNYVGVVAYCRGIRTNLDKFFPYEKDGNDAYDVIDWISKQPWCDGRVGMYGGSYLGFVQWSTVKKIHPALKTIVPQVAVMPGFDSPMENNVPQGFALTWPNDILKYKPLPQDLNFTWFDKGTSYRSLDSLAGQPNRIFQKWLNHPGYDNYWKSMIPTSKEFANIHIPILSTTGYYDGAQSGNMQYIRLYHKYNKNPNLYFVIGPYDHFGGQRRASTYLYGYHIDTVANISMRELAFQWFDYIFKGKNKPEILKDKINFEVMGANEWKHVSTLEQINNDTLTFYLSNIPAEKNNYLLSAQKPGKPASLEQLVDLKDRITQNNYYTPLVINDSIDKSYGLMFISDVFTTPITINGAFHGQLNAWINKKDFDFSLAFFELMTDGKYFNLGSYVGRASYAKNNRKRQLLSPNRKETIPFGNSHLVIKKINEGSRLVIILNVNKHPFEEINYGTGKNVHDETIKNADEPLLVKWFTDSFIKVPVWK
jgi:putative CocE/NonD family hydrolase